MICAIILAAGESRRMGTPKLLLPFGGTTVIGHIVDQLLRSALNSIFVVVGHEGDRIAAELSGRPASIVTNPDYKTGMLSSVRCGLRALPKECDAVMVVLGDQPAITAELVNEMVRSFAASGKGILVPLHEGRRGHPLLFPTSYRDEILTRYDDVGLRGLLLSHPDEVCEINVSIPSVLSDMDNPEDYRRELASFDENTRKTPKSRVE